MLAQHVAGHEATDPVALKVVGEGLGLEAVRAFKGYRWNRVVNSKNSTIIIVIIYIKKFPSTWFNGSIYGYIHILRSIRFGVEDYHVGFSVRAVFKFL